MVSSRLKTPLLPQWRGIKMNPPTSRACRTKRWHIRSSRTWEFRRRWASSSLRVAGLATRLEGRTEGDFAFHLETGLTSFIGLHVRNDRFLDKPRSEVMFQFAAARSKDGMSGFSPIIEFEIPTQSGDGSRINTLVGFSTALATARVSFNQVLHYNPREDMVDGSAALVFKVGKRFYPVMEVLAEAMRGDSPIVNVLLGLKVRVNEGLLLGFAFQVPTTQRKDFSSQSVFQPDMEWRWTP